MFINCLTKICVGWTKRNRALMNVPNTSFVVSANEQDVSRINKGSDKTKVFAIREHHVVVRCGAPQHEVILTCSSIT